MDVVQKGMIDIRDDIGNRYTKGVFYDPFLRFPLNHPKFQQHGIHFYVIDLNMLDLLHNDVCVFHVL